MTPGHSLFEWPLYLHKEYPLHWMGRPRLPAIRRQEGAQWHGMGDGHLWCCTADDYTWHSRVTEKFIHK